MRIIAIALFSLFLGSCANVSQDIIAACQEATVLGLKAESQLKGGAQNTATDIMNNYVAPACSTATAIAQVAEDPTTAAWLGGISQQFKTLLGI